MHLDATLVVPLNDAMYGFAVIQDHNHRRTVLHLLDVIKVFGAGLLGRGRLSPLHAGPHLVLDFR